MEKIRQLSEIKQKELPKTLDVPYPYIVMEDIPEVAGRIDKKISKNTLLSVQKAISLVLGKAAPDGVTFMTTESRSLVRRLEIQIRKELKDPETGVVQLDRYICAGWEKPNLTRLDLSRSIDGGLTSRPGADESTEEQVGRLIRWAEVGGYKKLLLVDDVLAYGDTLTALIVGLREILPNSEIEVLVGISSSGGGWGGRERVENETGASVRAMSVVKASDENEWTSGMALPTARDFTFMGGKVWKDDETGIQYSFPYFLPFSVPVLSFMPAKSRIGISIMLMELSVLMSQMFDEELGRKVTIGEFESKGFGIPTTKLACLSEKSVLISREIPLTDYLKQYQSLMEENLDEIKKEVGGD